MNFRQHTTFNIQDTHYVRDGRHIVANGVEERCDSIVQVMSENDVACAIQDIIRYLGDDSYTYGDILYAMKCLYNLGVVEPTRPFGPGGYRGARGGNTFWRLAPRARRTWARVRRQQQAA